MARRRRKATKKAESSDVADADTSLAADEVDSSLQEEDSEEIMETTSEGNKDSSQEITDKDASESIPTEEISEPMNVDKEKTEENDSRDVEEDVSEPTADDAVQKPDDSDTKMNDVAESKTSSKEESNSMDADVDASLSDAPMDKFEVVDEVSSEQKTEDSYEDSNNIPAEEKEKVKITESDNEYQMEADKVPLQKIDKIPKTPECHDDNTCKVAVDPEADEDDEVIGSESAEFLKYWRAVLENPHDFTNWTYLLQLVEQENKPPLARRAYNGFFKRYPLCYGYWKKFSEMEKRNGNFVRAQRILERGVRAIPLSIDLWVHMIDFYINHYKGPDAGTEKVAKVFERAIASSGCEFRSEKLWNKYIQWQQANKNWKAVVDAFDRVLKIPTQHYSIFFKDYKDFINSRSPKEILDLEEFETLLNEVRDDADENSKNNESSDQVDPEIDDDAPPGVESSDRSKPPNEKELKAVNEKIIAIKKKVFDETEGLVTKIWSFEEGIKRPYFHVKALERTQIKNWRDYLDAEISRGEEQSRVVLLFERCLIACALYEDFWLKYARYLAKVDAEAARTVFKRACEIHLPKKPNIHLHWASFEEVSGNYSAAACILEKLDKTLPDMAMIRLRRVATERRAGNIEVAENLLKTFLSDSKKGTEECFYARKYAWFLAKVSNKLELGRQVLKDCIEKNPENVQLYKDLVGLDFMYGTEENIIEACDIALNSLMLPEDVKFQISQRKLEYLEDFGLDARRTQKTYDEHQKLVRNQKKRTLSEPVALQPLTKKAKTEQSTSPVGNKIMSTSSNRYTASTTTNGNYASPISSTITGQATTVPAVQSATLQAQQQAYTANATATSDPSVYYQNYWNYQKQNEVQQQYNQYNQQWSQYSQQYYQQ